MHNQRGFTLVEVVVVMALLALVLVKVGMLLQIREQTESRELSSMVVDDQAQRVLDQIAYAVMGASREKLFPDPTSPVYSSELQFSVSLGVEDGEVVWGDTQWVGLTKGDRQLAWRERPDEIDERRVVWCNVVRPFLEGEIVNGVDDNGNDLVDEKGLTFSLEGDRVSIQLSLERTDGHGNPMVRTVEQVVTCRN